MRPRPAVSWSNTVVCSGVSFSGEISRIRFMVVGRPGMIWICRCVTADPLASVAVARVSLWPHSEKPVLRPRQPQIFAQGLAFVFAPVDPAPLQLRYDAVDEVIEPSREVRELHGEAVGALGGEPFLHLVGD